MMSIQILKNNEWRTLQWPSGAGPVVLNELELGKLFEFVVPAASVTAYLGKNSEFGYGGDNKITSGDTVRIIDFDKDRNIYEIFRGRIDDDISWNMIDETVAFKALSFGISLKDVLLGREPRPGNTKANFRYVRSSKEKIWTKIEGILTEEGPYDIEYLISEEEYQGWREKTPAKQIGYEKSYIFSTITGQYEHHPFADEAALRPPYRVEGLYNSDGTPRRDYLHWRIKSQWWISGASLSEIAAEVLKQVNIELDYGDSSKSVVIKKPEEDSFWPIDGIAVDIREPIIKEAFELVGFFLRRYPTELLCAGWVKEDPSLDPKKGSPVKLGEIQNTIQWIPMIELPFGLHNESYKDRGIRAQLSLSFNSPELSENGIWSKRIHYSYTLTEEVFYKLWSWVEKDVIFDDQNHEIRRWVRCAMLEWHIVDLANPLNATHHKQFFSPQQALGDIIEITDENAPMPPYKFAVIDLNNESRAILYSEETENQEAYDAQMFNDRVLAYDMAQYSISSDGVPVCTGKASLSHLGFELKGTSASEIIKDLAILTESYVLFENKSGDDTSPQSFVMKFIPRNFTGEVIFNLREEDVLRLTNISKKALSNSDFRIKMIESAAITKAIIDYYKNHYPPDRDDWYQVEVVYSSALSQIKLFDKVSLPLSCYPNGKPEDAPQFIVRKIEFREDIIVLLLSQSTVVNNA